MEAQGPALCPRALAAFADSRWQQSAPAWASCSTVSPHLLRVYNSTAASETVWTNSRKKLNNYFAPPVNRCTAAVMT